MTAGNRRARRLDHQCVLGEVPAVDRVLRGQARPDEPISPGNVAFIVRHRPLRRGRCPVNLNSK